MELNIPNFIELIRKATVNYSMDFTQLRFENNKIHCSIINAEQNIISKLSVENNVISDLTETIELNMAAPNENIIPYLSMFQTETVSIKYTLLRNTLVKDFKLTNDGVNVKLNFSEPLISRYFSKTINTPDVIFQASIDDTLIQSFNKIKKIALRTNKLYFVVEDDNILFLESGDRSTPHVNSVKVKLQENIECKFIIEFIFKNIQSLLEILSKNKKYTLVMYSKTCKAGLLRILADDESEDYVLGSQNK